MPIVKSNAKSIYRCSGITFVPGFNEVKDEELALLVAHPLFMKRVESGFIELPKEKKVEDFKLKTLPEILRIIEDTYSLDILDKLEQGEIRQKVLKAIEARRKGLMPQVAKDEQE